MSDKITNIVGTLLGTLIAFAIISLIAWATYNTIAWDFNLPPFSYWTVCGVMYTLDKIIHGIKVNK